MLELDETMSDLSDEGYSAPCPANAIFFSNDPSHYAMTTEVGGAVAQLWIKPYTPKTPRIPHPPSDMTARILKAFTQRLSPPDKFPDLR